MNPKLMSSGLFSVVRRSRKAMKEKPGVILDFDKDGNVVGMEILDESGGWKIQKRSNTL